MAVTYDSDFYSWALAQAEALRRRSGNEIDWDNVAEEIEGLSRSEVRELASRYTVLLAHLLKWLVQPERRSRSWANTIGAQRAAIATHLADNPGLKSKEAATFADAYLQARYLASTETDLPLESFPAAPPFSFDEAKDPLWQPGAGEISDSSAS